MQQQGQSLTPTTHPAWVSFARYLQLQRGEADSSSSQPGGAAAHSSNRSSNNSSSSSSDSGSSGRTSTTGGAPLPAAGVRRHAAVVPDCRGEVRLVGDSCRAHQEVVVTLAAPGLPLAHAPTLTTKQVGSLLKAISQPLVELPVGRLTRLLEAPTKLQPTSERGVLSLWLLPGDDLSLVWQASVAVAATAATPDAAAAPAVEDAGPSQLSSGRVSAAGEPQQALPAPQASCSGVLWEELARFPAGALFLDDAPLVTIHMLRADRTGRSFYIRPRADMVPGAASASPSTSAAPAAPGNPAPATSTIGSEGSEGGVEPRLYFWLAESDLAHAAGALGRLKSYLKHPPTLSSRTGVPEDKLERIGSWLRQMDVLLAQQAQQAQVASEPQPQGELHAALTPSSLLGGPALPLAQLQSSLSTYFWQAGQLPELAPTDAGGAPLARSTAVVTASAGAMYRECRFGISCPASATVVVNATVTQPAAVDESAAAAQQLYLSGEAAAVARAAAEARARAVVDFRGRQRIEEQLAELLLRNVRAQRSKARSERRQAREQQARMQQVEAVRQRIRQACRPAAAAATAAAATVSGPAVAPADAGAGAGAHASLAMVRLRQEQDASMRSPFAAAVASAAVPPAVPAAVTPSPGAAAAAAAASGVVAEPLVGRKVSLEDLQQLLAVTDTANSHHAAQGGRRSSGNVSVNDLPELLKQQQAD